MLRKVLTEGLVAGAVGVTTMTALEKLEQRLTGRPDSHVPARVLERLAGAPDHEGGELRAWNLAMHYGQGIVLGPLRSLMAHAGLRGPVASAKFAVLRLTNDQVLENLTGVGAPPETWPRSELVVDLVHKAAYAVVTGVVADALAARSGPGPGQLHAAQPGRRSGVGPLPRGTAGAKGRRCTPPCPTTPTTTRTARWRPPAAAPGTAATLGATTRPSSRSGTVTVRGSPGARSLCVTSSTAATSSLSATAPDPGRRDVSA